MAVQISPQQYELMDREFKCPICRCVFTENPKWLPCQHVFCNDCLKQQIQREKKANTGTGGGRMQLTRCAECKMEFSHRNLRENLRFNRLLDLWKQLRT